MLSLRQFKLALPELLYVMRVAWDWHLLEIPLQTPGTPLNLLLTRCHFSLHVPTNVMRKNNLHKKSFSRLSVPVITIVEPNFPIVVIGGN